MNDPPIGLLDPPVAKPKSQPKSKPEPAAKGRPKSERGPRSHALGIKAYPEWKQWLADFRAHCAAEGLRTPDVVDVIDLALIELARKLGFRLPPER